MNTTGHVDLAGLATTAAIAIVIASNCGGQTSPTSPTPSGASTTNTVATVRFVYRASTSARTDLPASAQDCLQLVGHTHIHPSWQGFARMDLRAVGNDQWEMTFSDVPVNARQSFRVNDPNACDQNATGAVTRNVFANDVSLTEVVPTPGGPEGTEPGLAFTVSPDGRIAP